MYKKHLCVWMATYLSLLCNALFMGIENLIKCQSLCENMVMSLTRAQLRRLSMACRTVLRRNHLLSKKLYSQL